MPFFSVVIPLYNRADLIGTTLKSVLAQEFEDYEVIVVDDGSTDNSVAVVKDYIERFAGRLRISTQANQGPGAARNKGIYEAQGNYIAFLDSDDLWFPWTLQTYVQALQESHLPSLLSGRLVEFSQIDLLEAVKNTKRETLQSQFFDDYFASYIHQVLLGAGMAVMRRDVAQSSGGFTTLQINAEDHDLALRLGDAKGFVNIMTPVTVAYRQHETNVTTNVSRSFQGIMHLIKQENCDAYPGGSSRCEERLNLITMHTRPVSLDCLSRGDWKRAFRIYGATWLWNLRLRRWRYIFGFPLQYAGALLKRKRHSHAG